ncbi:MAG: AbrB/MazE/SpoVT family DNA-binding domain-containing protein [Alicycliphilus sp.]|nr:AbrB/MazE/SpoVT family DNA-binding domain-containing protein [Alicycliphilus sp.]
MPAHKPTQIGNSIGGVPPTGATAGLQGLKGDSESMTTDSKGFVLSPCGLALEEDISAGRHFGRECRDTFQRLAQ